MFLKFDHVQENSKNDFLALPNKQVDDIFGFVLVQLFRILELKCLSTLSILMLVISNLQNFQLQCQNGNNKPEKDSTRIGYLNRVSLEEKVL